MNLSWWAHRDCSCCLRSESLASKVFRHLRYLSFGGAGRNEYNESCGGTWAEDNIMILPVSQQAWSMVSYFTHIKHVDVRFGAADNTPSCGFDLCKHFVNVNNCRFSKSIKRKIELEAGNCLSDSMDIWNSQKGSLCLCKLLLRSCVLCLVDWVIEKIRKLGAYSVWGCLMLLCSRMVVVKRLLFQTLECVRHHSCRKWKYILSFEK